MAVPTAPAAGEPIAEAWGDVVHDQVVAQEFQFGRTRVTGTNAASQSLAVVFPHPYDAAAGLPHVVVSVSAGSSVFIAGSGSLSATGFTIIVFRRDGGVFTNPVDVEWISYGKRT